MDDSLIMLVVEDNPADVFFFNEAFDANRTDATVHVVTDGDMAMQFLRHQAPFADAPRPDVIVLDLNLPIKSGREVLAEMAADPALETIPVAILTSSAFDRSACDVYPAGRCLYFVKTHEFRQLQDIVGQIAAHARTARNQ